MAKAMQLGIDAVARNVTQPFLDVDLVTRKVTNGHVGVSAVARHFYESVILYKWAKYQSYCSSTTYGEYQIVSSSEELTVWPNDSISEISGLITNDGSYVTITCYNSFSYSQSTGKFTMVDQVTVRRYTAFSFSVNDIETKLVGKFINMNGKVYIITGHDDINTLLLGKRFDRGSPTYTYKYSYVGEVTSEDPDAYTTGSTSSYTSSSANDIRTVYVAL